MSINKQNFKFVVIQFDSMERKLSLRLSIYRYRLRRWSNFFACFELTRPQRCTQGNYFLPFLKRRKMIIMYVSHHKPQWEFRFANHFSNDFRKRHESDSNLVARIATCSTQNVNQIPMLQRKLAKFPSKEHPVWLYDNSNISEVSTNRGAIGFKFLWEDKRITLKT